MDLFNALTYLNKLSLIAFFVVAVILIYQVAVMRKESKSKKAPTAPVVPNFSENMAIPVKNFTSVNEEKLVKKTRPMPKGILYSIVGVTAFCLIAVVYLINRQNQTARIDGNVAETGRISPTLVARQTVSPTASMFSASPTSIISRAPTPTPVANITPGNDIPTKAPTSYITPSPTSAFFAGKTATVAPTASTAPIFTKVPTAIANKTVSKDNTLPLTGTVENTIIIGFISGFLIMLAFVF